MFIQFRLFSIGFVGYSNQFIALEIIIMILIGEYLILIVLIDLVVFIDLILNLIIEWFVDAFIDCSFIFRF